MPSNWIKSSWFQYFDLLCATVAAVVWSLQRQADWWPFLIALIPWLLRVFFREFPFHRTQFDALILVFGFTAALGVWSSYDPNAAWQKFWVLIGAIFIYYALARQPTQHIPSIAGFLALLGGFIATAFLFLHNWNSKPADFDFINRISVWWLNSVPRIGNWDIDPNKAAGILVFLFPFALAYLGDKRQHRNKFRYYWLLQTLIFIAMGLMLFGLLMSSSRGAWVVFLMASSVWFLWRKYLKFEERSKQSIRHYLIPVLLVAMILGGFAVYYFGVQLLARIDSLPGYPSGVSRYELAKNTIHLIADYPIIGGGLNAFAGQYSQYILVIPDFFFSNAHNIFLDVALEQGLIGLASYVLITIGSVCFLLRNPALKQSGTDFSWFKQAVVVSLLVMVLHGFFDDAIYGNQGTSLLFVPAGLTIALSQNRVKGPSKSNTLITWERYWKIALVLVVTGVMLFLSKPVRSVWNANLGAIQMARIQLVDYPSGKWDEHVSKTKFDPVEGSFKVSLASNPANVTANYRMGLIAMHRLDYPTAVSYLETAYSGNQEHRGIRKNLGYCYVWLEDYDKAESMLVGIPEAGRELAIYSWWWGALGKVELAEHAHVMAVRLAE